ncbi:MAG: hypothetical protein K6F73_07840 [Lachnospiraceae bacterium]|nr:hypothetical protein [Lachnospiraceae bacterium]
MKNIDWHAGFVSAMKLELIENETDLDYIEERHIANRAQRIDLLIIRNDTNAQIVNPIGAIFGRFNICEYKSPGQPLAYSDFYKTLAYACLLLEETQKPCHNGAAKYTMTIVREAYPRDLFKLLRADGIGITLAESGIYRLTGNLPFRTQVIITGSSPEQVSWLGCLTKKGTEYDLEHIVANTLVLDGTHKKEADIIMDIFTSANRELVVKEMEEPDMCNAVNELFADKIKEMEAIVADKDSLLADKDSLLADKDLTIADKDAIIAKLQAQIDQLHAQLAEKSNPKKS